MCLAISLTLGRDRLQVLTGRLRRPRDSRARAARFLMPFPNLGHRRACDSSKDWRFGLSQIQPSTLPEHLDNAKTNESKLLCKRENGNMCRDTFAPPVGVVKLCLQHLDRSPTLQTARAPTSEAGLGGCSRDLARSASAEVNVVDRQHRCVPFL